MPNAKRKMLIEILAITGKNGHSKLKEFSSNMVNMQT